MTVQVWGGRAASDALTRVKAEGRRHNRPCCICHGAIDYDLRYPNPWSCSVQHVISRHLRPDLTWDPGNWQPAHLDCNKRKGDGATIDPYDLGITS